MKTQRNTHLNVLKLSLIMFGIFLFISGTGQTNVNDKLVFDDWDQNNDGRISQSEFVEQFKKDDDFVNKWKASSNAATMDRNTTEELKYGGYDNARFDVDYGNIGEDGRVSDANRSGQNSFSNDTTLNDTTRNYMNDTQEWGDVENVEEDYNDMKKDRNSEEIYRNDTTLKDTTGKQTSQWGDVENIKDYKTRESTSQNFYGNDTTLNDTARFEEWGDAENVGENDRFENDIRTDSTISDRFNEANEPIQQDKNPDRFGDKSDMKEYDRTNKTTKVGIDRKNTGDMHKNDHSKMKSDMNYESGYYSSTFGTWDKNRDYRLDESEWREGCDKSAMTDAYKDYGSIDTDKDNYVSYEEFSTAMSDTDFYSDYDKNRDRKLDKEELGEMVFDTWDYDQSNSIEKDEFQHFKDYYKNFK